MTDSLEMSYKICRKVAQSSGSNFVRTFDFLREDRRRAMFALYAFSRLADDATDGIEADAKSATSKENKVESNPTWQLDRWLEWIDSLSSSDRDFSREASRKSSASNLNPSLREVDFLEVVDQIRPALADSVQRFSIPTGLLKELVRGVDHDVHHSTIDSYTQLQTYMDRVASAVGLCCLAIWSPEGLPSPGSEQWQDAVHCGHAFQLTNILRDVVEDAQRSRIYLAGEDLKKFGFDSPSWIEALNQADPKAREASIASKGNWLGLMQVYQQRAEGCYTRGWNVRKGLEPDSLRMFSMMWQTYHAIFEQIARDPWGSLRGRASLSNLEKGKLVANHLFTPWFRKRLTKLDTLELRNAVGLAAHSPESDVESRRNVESNELSFAIHRTHSPRIAVIGGGLAGIQAATVLAKHGCHVELFEARHRLGGRVGSFDDSGSNRPVDYCQHVGMKCCKELLRWISDQGQAEDWQEQSTLYFRSRKGVPFRVKAWPVPAPYHLAGLLLRWPDLTLSDRIGIAKGLLALLRIKPDEQFSNTLAVDWLKANGQSQSSILNFWTTILVSALGDQLPRLRMGAVRKVMVDGFAATRDAYHLYVPNRPLSELVDVSASKVFDGLGVASHYGQVVTGLVRSDQGKWSVSVRSSPQSKSKDGGDASESFDAVVVAVPWHRLASVFSPSQPRESQPRASQFRESQLSEMTWSESQVQAWSSPVKLASAPITGVHTWWTKRWLPTPHAILIDRTSQWVFPGPDTTNGVDSGGDAPEEDAPEEDATEEQEFYYQVVISGSRDLPKGDPTKVAEIVETDLREVFPEISSTGARMLRSKVVTDPHSVFSVDPEGASEKSAGTVVGVDGRLPSGMFSDQGIILAGDWTQTGWPATMEGALRSGSLAAQCVLGLLGRPAQIAIDAE